MLIIPRLDDSAGTHTRARTHTCHCLDWGEWEGARGVVWDAWIAIALSRVTHSDSASALANQKFSVAFRDLIGRQRRQHSPYAVPRSAGDVKK